MRQNRYGHRVRHCAPPQVNEPVLDTKIEKLQRNFGDVFVVGLGGEGAVGVVGGDAFE